MQDLIGMTIREAIMHIDDQNTPIKVGAKNGTSFIFCGPVCELFANLSNLELEHYTKSVKSISKQQIKMDNLLNSFPTPESYSRKIYEESDGTDIGTFEGWEEAVRKHFKLLHRNKQQLIGMESKHENRVPFRNRKIVDMYTSISEPDVWIFLIEGSEKGSYWDRHEYVNGVNEDEDEDESESTDTDRSSAECGGEEEA